MLMEFSKVWQNGTLEGIELLKASFQQFEFSKHWHDDLAIGVIEKGAEGLYYRGNNIVIPENQIVTINPAEVHTGFAGCDTGWKYRMFYFKPEMIHRHFEQSDQDVLPFIKSPILNDPELFRLLMQLHIALEEPAFDITKESLLTICFEMLFGRHGDHAKLTSKAIRDRQKNAAMREYLLANWRNNVSIEELEEVSDLSKFQLIRSFNSQYGVTPHQFLLVLKINRAKRLLVKGDSCTDTALECGFFDQSHLTRNFKRAFGITPKRYATSFG